MYHEVTIIPASGGFGEYQTNPTSGESGWDNADDLVAEMAGQCGGAFFELGVDELIPPIEDIRGSIHNEPSRVFAVIHDDDSVSYYGIIFED